jgi:hypothetical protein
VAIPLSLGSSKKEVAAELGITLKSVEFLMDALRSELCH